MPLPIQPPEPTVTTFVGEGKTRRFAQGVAAISGVAAHEAANIVSLSAQATRAGQVVVDKTIELHFAINTETGRLEVVGGRARVTFRPAVGPEPLPTPAAPAESADPGASEAAPDAAGAAPTLSGASASAVLDQAAAAVDERMASVAQRLPAATSAERPLLEAELRALRGRREQIGQAQQEAEVRRVAVQVGQALARPAGPGAGAGPVLRPPGGGVPAGPSRGVFIPAMTQRGLLVNTSA